MKREEVGELVERGIRELNEALAAGKSDRLQKYLDVMARLLESGADPNPRSLLGAAQGRITPS